MQIKYCIFATLQAAGMANHLHAQNFDIDLTKDKTTYSATSGQGYDILPVPKAKGNAPFFYSVKVPDGNYKVVVTIGSKKKAGKTVVRAENRRMMLDEVATRKGEFKTFSFTVNKRSTYISDTKQVKIKPREKDYPSVKQNMAKPDGN